MSEIQAVADSTLKQLEKRGAQKSQVLIFQSEVQELQLENNKMSLLRSTFDQGVNCKVILNQRQALKGANQFDLASLEELTSSVITQAQSGSPDEAFDIAPPQAQQVFQSGLSERNDDWAFEKLDQFLSETGKIFPQIIMTSMLKFVRTKKILVNSNSTHFESAQGYYEFGCFFSGQEGKKSSSFNGVDIVLGQVSAPLMEMGGVRELLRENVEQLNVSRIPGKFEGDLIITPHALSDFIGGIFSFLRTRSLLTGTSIYKDKLNKKVASDKLTIRSLPTDPRFLQKSFWTGDGFLSQSHSIIENGILKTFLLDQYGANKLKQSRALSDASHLHIEPGSRSLKEMISSVKKGLVLGRFSGGHPSENGDFSGIAKNSYYVENGEIVFPVSEVMISGNLERLFLDLTDISKEVLENGRSTIPWIKTTGVTIS